MLSTKSKPGWRFGNTWIFNMITPRRRQTLRGRVHAGFAFLTAKLPPGWKINLHRLDMASATHCMLGEIYGSYNKGTEILFAEFRSDTDAAVALGFIVEQSRSGNEAGTIKEYQFLTREWRAAYQRGQSARRRELARLNF